MNTQMLDEKEQPSKPTLIYFKARGHAQTVRYVLYEIGVDFDELFISCSGYLDPNIIKKYQIDLKSLPYLIDGDVTLFGIFPIIKYLCVKYNRTDLMGKTFQHQLFIAEFMVKEMREKSIILNTLFKGVKEVYDKNLGQQGLFDLTKKIIQSVEKTKNIQPIKQMLKQMSINQNKYLLGYLTILDFVVFQRCFYASNLKYPNFPQTERAKLYYNSFLTSDFYKAHKKKIEQYKVFFPEVDCNLNQIVQKLWVGDFKYVEQD